MNRLRIIVALVLLCGLALGAQAQSDPTRETPADAVARAFRALVNVTSEVAKALQAAALPVCADLDHDNLQVERLDDAVPEGAVYCREIARDGEFLINPGAIGNRNVIERGVRQAYDLFGLTVEGVAVDRFDHAITFCLRGHGSLIFLPAFASPRPAQTPQSYPRGEFTCARLGSPGIVALVGGQ